MTGDERLAKVAEVLRKHEPGAFAPADTACMCDRTWRTHAAHQAHTAQALAPLLDEFRAEDEARALRAAADTLWRIFLRLPHTPSPLGDYVQRKSQEFRRAALGAAEPDAGER